MDDVSPRIAPLDRTALPQRKQITILVRIGAALIVVVALVTILRSLLGGHEEQSVPTEPGIFRPTKAQMQSFDTTTIGLLLFRSEQITDGKIATNDDTTTPVFSPYSGRVTRLIAKAGDMVQQGQPLFAIQASEFVQAQNDLISASAALKTAEAQLKLAEANEKRAHEVYEARGGALKDWLQSQSDLVNAQGSHRTAEIALAAVRNRLRILGKTDQEIATLEATPETTRTSPEAIVAAPIGGTIIQRQVGVGQYINSAANGAANPVYSIGNLSTVWLVANVREADAPKMKIGEPVEVHVLAFPDRTFKAHLAYVGSMVDPNTRRVTVRAEVENSDGALKPEMFASFRIVTSEEADAPAAPQIAVVYEGDSAHVWVIRDDGAVVIRPIKIGRMRDGMVEVLEGLRAGEKIVTGGSLFIDRAAEANS